MLCALLVTLALLAFVTWGWASERGIRRKLLEALDVERESYRALVAVFNERTIGASLKHPTVRFSKEHIREQAKHTTTRLTLLPTEAPERKRPSRH